LKCVTDSFPRVAATSSKMGPSICARYKNVGSSSS
jgi:hypothetical protein